MLPFKPETVEEMKSRFAPVLATLFSIKAIEEGKSERPGALRDFVFDFEDGMRMIASREFLDEERHFHVSCSVQLDSKLIYISKSALRDDIIYRLKDIHEAEYEVENSFITKNQIVHLLMKDIC